MQFDRTLTKHYPKLTAWISQNIPRVRDNKPDVWSAFRDTVTRIGIDLTTAERAVAVNNYPPTIDACILVGAYGAFKPVLKCNRDRIFLARWFCRDFEHIDRDITIVSWMDLALEATILHEMVHWADYKDGVETDDDDEGDDIGAQFEKDAYNTVVTYIR
jgi:hypothetical protein